MQNGVNEPRLRVNKTTGLALSTTWQDLVFNGTSTVNVNTFGIDTASGKKMVDYDPATNIFRFYEKYDVNYNITMYMKSTATLVSTGNTIQYRIVVPNGVSPGVDFYFPFPDTDGYADVVYVGLKIGSVNHIPVIVPMYLSSTIRTNGIRIQMRLGEALVGIGTVTVNNVAVLIQQ